jgi:hypothetical protein
VEKSEIQGLEAGLGCFSDNDLGWVVVCFVEKRTGWDIDSFLSIAGPWRPGCLDPQ